MRGTSSAWFGQQLGREPSPPSGTVPFPGSGDILRLFAAALVTASLAACRLRDASNCVRVRPRSGFVLQATDSYSSSSWSCFSSSSSSSWSRLLSPWAMVPLPAPLLLCLPKCLTAAAAAVAKALLLSTAKHRHNIRRTLCKQSFCRCT